LLANNFRKLKNSQKLTTGAFSYLCVHSINGCGINSGPSLRKDSARILFQNKFEEFLVRNYDAVSLVAKSVGFTPLNLLWQTCSGAVRGHGFFCFYQCFFCSYWESCFLSSGKKTDITKMKIVCSLKTVNRAITTTGFTKPNKKTD